MIAAAGRVGTAERSVAWVVAIAAALVAVFWPTTLSMVATWSSSETYSHGFLIAPAFLWLVWVRRHELARLPIEPCWWALPVLAVISLLWLAGQWTSLALATQFALVAMLPVTVAAILGLVWVRALLFPFAFLFFAVPFGDSWVPTLMDWTADFTVAALRLSGVPVYRDGLHFAIPSGNWSVVDSCSGIRYLFACLAVSSLYAWMIFRGATKRLLFIGCALAIAVVANWVRAYAIVMLGHISDNQIATGADHLVYGGLFFGLIMALVFALGAVWREDAAPPWKPGPQDTVPARDPARDTGPRFAAMVLAVAVLLGWPSLSIVSAQDAAGRAVSMDPIRPRAGWQPLAEAVADWQPKLNNPAAVVSQTFGKDAYKVGIHVGVFHRSTPDSKLTSALNRLVEADGLNPRWKLVRQGTARAHGGGEVADVRTGVLIGPKSRLLAWQWYWVDGTATASPARAVLLQMLARLRGRSETSAWVSVHTPESEDPSVAAGVLQIFVADMSESIGSALWPRSAGGM